MKVNQTKNINTTTIINRKDELTNKKNSPIQNNAPISVSSNSKVEQIKRQISNGTFKVNPEAIADKLLLNPDIQKIIKDKT